MSTIYGRHGTSPLRMWSPTESIASLSQRGSSRGTSDPVRRTKRANQIEISQSPSDAEDCSERDQARYKLRCVDDVFDLTDYLRLIVLLPFTTNFQWSTDSIHETMCGVADTLVYCSMLNLLYLQHPLPTNHRNRTNDNLE